MACNRKLSISSRSFFSCYPVSYPASFTGFYHSLAMSSDTAPPTSYYLYDPSHVLPAVFAALVGISLTVHITQNFYYHSWKVMFFMVWGGAVYTSGWIMRCISSYYPGNKNLYIAQTVLVLAGPPIYSATEYNILGRLMLHLPMHAPMNPNRIVYFFIYLGSAVEGLTAAGGARLSSAGGNTELLRSGATLIAIAAVLQAVIECMFFSMIGWLHYRCVRTHMLTRRVNILCIMLYGTSALVLLRCIFRVIENFTTVSLISSSVCGPTCDVILRHEWYLYVFEAAPMVFYTYWLNIIHPGRFLPRDRNVYLDFHKIERVGPGWIDKRSQWQTFIDPLDLGGLLEGRPAHEKFWLRLDGWPTAGGDDYVDRRSLGITNEEGQATHTKLTSRISASG